MNKILRKLIAAGTMLAILFIMVITVSYAWFTFSDSPEIQGIQVSLGGGTTILIAPDQTQITQNGIYHYPGSFSRSLNFNKYAQYDYLNAVAALSPVSTADGLHWYLPTYYESGDKEVLDGNAITGQLKPIENFALDYSLDHANLTDHDAAKGGNFVYLDFWVVSPSEDYNIRIAQGDEDDGSFAIELMKPEETENGYELVQLSGAVAASMRIGFLVNQDTIMDDSILYYAASGAYSSSYTSLRGNYQEVGENILYSPNYNFTIYEPNGDLHPNGINGTYMETKPLAWNGGNVVEMDIRDRLTVQLTNSWRGGTNNNYYIEEAFQTAIAGGEYSSASEVEEKFYHKYLQGQVLPYVEKGMFIANTAALYESMVNGTVSQGALMGSHLSSVTSDICVAHLEKNIPQRIRMFIWLEGQDPDCKTIEGSATLSLGIELAGSQISKNEKSKQEN